MSTPLWSGRFDAAPDPEVFGYGKSLPVDRRLVEDDLTGSVAWAAALARAGVLTPDDASKIASGLAAVREAVREHPELIRQAEDEVGTLSQRRLLRGPVECDTVRAGRKLRGRKCHGLPGFDDGRVEQERGKRRGSRRAERELPRLVRPRGKRHPARLFREP